MSSRPIAVLKPHRLALFLLLLVSLPLRAEVINISSAELGSLAERGVPIIDVRLAEEWIQTGVVPGSNKMTFFDEKGGYDAKKWFAELNQVAGREDPVILICLTGVRSRVIANWLSGGMGYAQVYNVTRGIDDWMRRGLPVVRD
jgi:rhodanese-related sulfurtransferase